MRKPVVHSLLLLAAMSLFQASGWAQCVMCGTALASSPESAGLVESFRWGILLLMGIPYVALGTVGFVILRAHRKKVKAQVLAAQVRPDVWPLNLPQ